MRAGSNHLRPLPCRLHFYAKCSIKEGPKASLAHMALVGQALQEVAWDVCIPGRTTAAPLLFERDVCASVGRRHCPGDCNEAAHVCANCQGELRRVMTHMLFGAGWSPLCSTCWLSCSDSIEVAIEAVLHTQGGVDFVRQLLLQREAPFAPYASAPERIAPPSIDEEDSIRAVQQDGSGAEHGCTTHVAPLLTVLWDSLHMDTALRARALAMEFPGLCNFVEMRDAVEVERLISLCRGHDNDDMIRRRIAREAGLSAVLECGVFLTECERHPKALLFELLYRRTVRLPPREKLQQMECTAFAPLRALQSEVCPPSESWKHPEALRIIAASLETYCFALVDGFLPVPVYHALQRDALELFVQGSMKDGVHEQKGNYGGYWGSADEGDVLNREGLPRKWAMEGDRRCWLADACDLAPNISLFTRAADQLVSLLKDGRISPASVTARLQGVIYREHTMVACYPGEERGRYLRHCDTGRGAALTCILYLNDDWHDHDGGALRLYEKGCHNTQVKYDVLPTENRLLLFWATEECPHEVLPTLRNRLAMTVWYRDIRGLSPAALVETRRCCLPVG